MTAAAAPSIKRRNYGRSGHGYTIDGQKADGVTTLLGKGLPKPGLIGWAAKTTANYAIDHWDELAELPPSQRLERLLRARFDDVGEASVRGTDVHKLAEKLVRGEEVEVPEHLRGYVESYVQFLDDFDVQPVLVESVVANRRTNTAGTLDLVADFIDPRAGEIRRWLCDIKTSRSGVFADTALQLAGYAHSEVHLDADGVEHPMADLGIQQGAVIHVRADGYDVVPFVIDVDPFTAFRHVAWLARQLEHFDDWRGEALLPPRIAARALSA